MKMCIHTKTQYERYTTGDERVVFSHHLHNP